MGGKFGGGGEGVCWGGWGGGMRVCGGKWRGWVRVMVLGGSCEKERLSGGGYTRVMTGNRMKSAARV